MPSGLHISAEVSAVGLVASAGCAALPSGLLMCYVMTPAALSCVARALCAEGSWLCVVINGCLSVSLSETSLHDMLCRHVISQAVQA